MRAAARAAKVRWELGDPPTDRSGASEIQSDEIDDLDEIGRGAMPLVMRALRRLRAAVLACAMVRDPARGLDS